MHDSVAKAAYLLNFFKFIDRPRNGRIAWYDFKTKLEEQRHKGMETRRHIYCCLNQYDMFRFSEIIDNTRTVDQIVNEPLTEFSLADRRYLCYALDSDPSARPDFDAIFNPENFLAVVFVKINNKIDNGPVDEENHAIKVFSRIVADKFSSAPFAAFRTFANKEIFFLINLEKLASIYHLVEMLQGVTVSSDISSKAFTLVNKWICCYGSDIRDEDLFKGEIRLYGVCNQVPEDKFTCLTKFPPSSKVERRTAYYSEDEVCRTICHRDEKILPSENSEKEKKPASEEEPRSLTVKEVIRHIFDRANCSKPSCAVSLNILVPRSDKANLKRYVLYNKKSPHMLEYDAIELLPDHKLKEIADLRADGIDFHRIEFLKISRFIQRKLRNYFQKTEYEDVIVFWTNIVVALKKYCDGGGEAERRIDPKYLLSTINNAMPLLRYLSNERQRPNMCSAWFDDGYYKTNISGFSKIANASSYIISTLMNKQWHDRQLDYLGLCTYGSVISYKQNPILSLLNTVFTALLEPKNHFGIFHEIGHILIEKLGLEDGIKSNLLFIIDKKIIKEEEKTGRLLLEIFADIFSHIFCITDFSVYLRNFALVFQNNMLYDLERYPISAIFIPGMERGSSSKRDIRREVTFIIFLRLLSASLARRMMEANNTEDLKIDTKKTFDFITGSFEEIDKGMKEVLSLPNTSKEILNTLNTVIGEAKDKWLENYCPFRTGTTSVVEVDMNQLNEWQNTFIYTFKIVRKMVSDYFISSSFTKFREVYNSINSNEEYVRLVCEEGKVYNGKIENPQKLISKLLVDRNELFSRNVATIVSLANNFPRRKLFDIMV